jgi:hypothetical protein
VLPLFPAPIRLVRLTDHFAHSDPLVKTGLVEKGDVKGQDIKEPAVKTLNTPPATTATNAP